MIFCNRSILNTLKARVGGIKAFKSIYNKNHFPNSDLSSISVFMAKNKKCEFCGGKDGEWIGEMAKYMCKDCYWKMRE